MKRSILGVVLWSLLAAGAALADNTQSTSAVILGGVTDESGGALIGASVFARNLESGREIFSSTDATGAFRFEVAPGRYRLTAAQADFGAESTDVEAAPGAEIQVGLQLRPAILSQQVVVSGSREQELAESSITNVKVISRTSILDTGYERLSDVLAEEPGIITRSGSSGNRSETQIWGMDSRQALLLIDGFPIVGGRGIKRGILNVDRQGTAKLERVEIVKGASSALYGTDSIAGVINMITRQPRRAFEANLTTAAGSLNAVDVRGDLGFMKNKWSGIFDVERHKRNPYTLVPGDFRTTGAGYRRFDYFGKLSYDFSEGLKIGLLANAFDNREQGRFFGELGPQLSTTNDSAQNYGITLNGAAGARTQWSARGYYGKYDESSLIDLVSRPADIDQRANLNERLYRLDASLSHVLGSRQLVQGGVEWTQNNYRGFNRVVGDNAGQQIRMVDLWLNDRIELHNRLSLTVGGRMNNHSRYGTHFVPRVGAMVRVTTNLRLRTSWGQGFRAPDLGQLYFRFLNPTNFYQVIGNPLLAPETSTTLQAGAEYRRGRVRISGNYFRNDIKNLIQADLIGRPTTPDELRDLMREFGVENGFNPGLDRLFFLYRNVDNVFTSGVEGSVEVRLTPDLLVSSGYTYLDARDKKTGAFLSQRHRHHGSFRVWWSTRRWGGLRTNLRGTYFGKWPVAGRGGSFIGDAYQSWSWYVAKPFGHARELYFSVDNLFDSTDSGLNAAKPTFLRADYGRTFRVGVRWSFRAD